MTDLQRRTDRAELHSYFRGSDNKIGHSCRSVDPRIDANATTAGNFASSIFGVLWRRFGHQLYPVRNLYISHADKDTSNLVGDDFLPLQIKILDLYGNVHYSGELNSVSDRIDVSGLPSGMYLVSFQKAGIAGITRKIVKQ
jgi:hypothetical protein